ncbi:MAG TPA: hypothetical protein VIJ14_03100 [Rhabdochlamydiaceae bacterium]
MKLTFPKTITNDPLAAGSRAAQPKTFGEFNRYKVWPMHTRFEAVQWFVTDVEQKNELDLPLVIRQESTLEAAIKGLV